MPPVQQSVATHISALASVLPATNVVDTTIHYTSTGRLQVATHIIYSISVEQHCCRAVCDGTLSIRLGPSLTAPAALLPPTAVPLHCTARRLHRKVKGKRQANLDWLRLHAACMRGTVGTCQLCGSPFTDPMRWMNHEWMDLADVIGMLDRSSTHGSG
jgi:hypothetical protein